MEINGDNFIIKLKMKNPRALEYVINEYGAVVNGVVRNIIGMFQREEEIEECIADIFIGIWENSEKFKGNKENFKNWVAGVSKFKAIDYYRKIKKSINYDEVTGDEIDNSINIEDEVILSMSSKESLLLINSLKEPDKSIFIMKFIYGYSSKKISSILGLTVSSIDTKVSRARVKIKREYCERKGEKIYE